MPSKWLIGMRSTSPGAARSVSTERVALDRELDGLAQEREPGVLLQRAREQAGFGEHLEPVADADDGTTRRRRCSATASITGEKRAMAPVRR